MRKCERGTHSSTASSARSPQHLHRPVRLVALSRARTAAPRRPRLVDLSRRTDPLDARLALAPPSAALARTLVARARHRRRARATTLGAAAHRARRSPSERALDHVFERRPARTTTRLVVDPSSKRGRSRRHAHPSRVAATECGGPSRERPAPPRSTGLLDPVVQRERAVLARGAKTPSRAESRCPRSGRAARVRRACTP